MTEPITQAELSRSLRLLEDAVAARVAAEQALATAFHHTVDSRQESLAAAIPSREAAFRERQAELISEHQERLRAMSDQFDAEQAAAEAARRDARNAIEKQTSAAVAEVNHKYEEARWVAQSVLDETSEDSPRRQFDRVSSQLDKSGDQQGVALAALQADVQAALEERGWTRPAAAPPEAAPRSLDDLAAAFMASIDEARVRLNRLRRLRIPKLFVGMRPLWLFVLLLIAVGLPAYVLLEPSQVGVTVAADEGAWIAMVAGAAFLVSFLLLTVLYTLSAMQLSEVFSSMQEAEVAADFYHQQWKRAAEAERTRKQKDCDERTRVMEQQLGEQLERFSAAHHQQSAAIEERRQSELNQIETAARREFDGIAIRRQAAWDAAEEDRRQREVVVEEQFQQDKARLQAALAAHMAEREQAQQSAVTRMTDDWKHALQSVAVTLAASRETSRELAPPWPAVLDADWQPPTAVPRGLRLGEYAVELGMLPGGMPSQAALIPPQTALPFPVILPFPSGSSLLMKTAGLPARRAAVQAMQVYLLRMLTLLPPGKLRLTIFDPVGLGESFAGLMHLADYDELLITSRIWTETAHIEARLADLTEHMENVLQKYLRNEFATIEAYNDFAGEVAEPYHLLVLADFPHKMSEQAARRLTSIATSGPRCGVYLLMSADPSLPAPHGFALSDVEAAATTLAWVDPVAAHSAASLTAVGESVDDQFLELIADSTFGKPGAASGVTGGTLSRYGEQPAFYLQTEDPHISRWPIRLDRPPDPERFTQIVKRIGEASKDVRRVEVSFGRIAPAPEDVWSKDSRREIDIPLGRAGATKLQHLRLGRGTSQHMLVAGKTGSGKSTFFHALITNAALQYSPDELEFYLVDFKKGVEFKAYTAGQLPHARVIAIESDREFGISVLQRLDGVLNERGELFRNLGVQDIAGYRDRRDAQPSLNEHSPSREAHRENGRGHGEALPTSLPRILLVIDEFQEFFVEDDRFSQQAALLLDRLVRQGRAFGIHVLLGSQTLGGAYSLARSTLGQVAVRVALQCSESDAHLILSESNTAARLLTRPGEAIYNDSNGSIEGNHPFQIAWLPDEERADYLAGLQQLARQEGRDDPPAIVFEGNIPSDPERNVPLNRLIEATDVAGPEATIWLGEAVEIGPPTHVLFPQQAGSNLLLVGQDPHAATGILATAYVALAAQVAPPSLPAAGAEEADGVAGASLWIFDGSPVGSSDAEFWKQLAGVSPERTRIVTPGNIRRALTSLAVERQRREQAGSVEHPPVFVIVASLSRFRDLRKQEDRFGFSGFGSAAPDREVDPSQQFADLLAKGPEQGIHVIVWVDSTGNLDRWLSRQSLKEFEQRVVFAMNAGDSTNLIDSPAAARLGPHRALLYREETGTTTKFRPYGPPANEWINRVRSHFAASQPLESARDLDGFQVS